jgi:hypothetical protein
MSCIVITTKVIGGLKTVTNFNAFVEAVAFISKISGRIKVSV